jgi:hypothetical protein
MYPDFANSFEVILGPGFDTVYCKYSNDRSEEFKIRTDIVVDKLGRKIIKKYPLTEAAIDHVFGMQDAYYGLREKYRGGDLEVNDCQLDEKGRCAIFSYVNGIPLTALFDACLESDDKDSFHALFREYMRRIGYRPDYPVTDYDLIFPNILVNGPIWTIIDYEWTYGKCIPAKEIAFRALYSYRLEDRSREKLDVKELYDQIGLTDEDIKNLLSEESEFQKYVTGRRKSTVEMWKLIGRNAIVPKELQGHADTARSAEEIQIYVDEGDGYSEDNSIFPEDTYDEHNTVTIDVETNDQVRNIRIDPAFSACIVTLKQVLWNDVSVEESEMHLTIHPNGAWISEDSIVFGTDDPNIEFGFTDDSIEKKRENHLKVTFMMTLIPKETAISLEDSLRVVEGDVQEEKGEFFNKIKRKIFSK